MNADQVTLLHVGAMPFPTRQGTQACVDAMCRACQSAGYETHLLTYGQGGLSSEDRAPNYRMHGLPSRRGAVRQQDQRSGPSLRKLVSDVHLVRALRSLYERLGPRAVIAHHVEAALLCQVAKVPYAWVAHTDLASELPTYFGHGAPAWSRAGDAVDHRCVRGAQAVAAVSPLLAARFAPPQTEVLPTPWQASDVVANQACGVPELIYAGNLDAYQGWQDVVDALALLARRGVRPRLTLLTASDPTPWLKRAAKKDVLSELRIVRHLREEDRLTAMRRTQVALVPRRVPGGLPMKLLDHWSLGHAVVAQKRALAGFSQAEQAVLCVADGDVQAMARAIELLLHDETERRSLAERGRAYLRAQHSEQRFVQALEGWLPVLRSRS